MYEFHKVAAVACLSVFVGMIVFSIVVPRFFSETPTAQSLRYVGAEVGLAPLQTANAYTAKTVVENNELVSVVVPVNTSQDVASLSVVPITKETVIEVGVPPVVEESVVLPLPKPVTLFTEEEVFIEALAAAIHERTNTIRKAAGAAPLTVDAALAKNARRYSQRMLTEGFLSHIDPSGCDMTCRFTTAAYTATAWGENLAWRRTVGEPSVDEVAAYFVREWQKSSGHRENILSSTFTHEGVGVAVKGSDIYVTVHFALPQ